MSSDSLAALLLVLCTVLVVRYLERQKTVWLQTLLQWVPPILFAYIVPAVVCALLGVNYQNVVLHQWSKAIIIPLAIITIMASMSLNALRIVGLKPLVLFVTGSFVIALLPVVLLVVLKQFFPTTAALFIDDGFWKGLIPLVGSWIGGSTSQLVLKEYVGTAEPLFLSVLVLDNVLVNIWTLLMFQLIRQSGRLDKRFGLAAAPLTTPQKQEQQPQKNGPLTLAILFVILLLTALLQLPFLGVIVVLSLLGLLLGNSFGFWHHQWCLKLGSFAIITVMAILGLKLNFGAFNLPLVFIGAVLLWLLLQFTVSFIMAYLLKISMVWVPIASMANFGGISTAPAVTAAYNPKLMPHAIVLAILSMVTGTFWGIFSTWLLHYAIGV